MEHTYGIEQGGNYREQGRFISLLRDLTEPDQALLEARIVDGWGYTTIARRLGTSRADLVKRVHRIQTDLRRKARALGAGEVKLDIAATMTV
jgi:DNA-directed RNA polymerase specialized sigma24 family protein